MFDTSHFHPMIVHFPIAIIIIGFLFDLFSLFITREKCLSKMGLYLEVLGMFAAIAAFGTGYYLFLTSPMDGAAGVLEHQHKLFATLTLISIILATFYRLLIVYQKKEETYLKYVAMSLFLCAFVFVQITGYLGGNLVYNYMVGV
jgi:uncharacterized membrane protein